MPMQLMISSMVLDQYRYLVKFSLFDSRKLPLKTIGSYMLISLSCQCNCRVADDLLPEKLLEGSQLEP